MFLQNKLVAVKVLHTIVWAFFVLAITFVLYSGISGTITTWSWIAAGLVICEGIILLIFNGACPLTGIARKYSSSAKANFDIYLPEWLARYNKQVFTSLYFVGLVLMLARSCS